MMFLSILYFLMSHEVSPSISSLISMASILQSLQLSLPPWEHFNHKFSITLSTPLSISSFLSRSFNSNSYFRFIFAFSSNFRILHLCLINLSLSLSARLCVLLYLFIPHSLCRPTLWMYHALSLSTFLFISLSLSFSYSLSLTLTHFRTVSTHLFAFWKWRRDETRFQRRQRRDSRRRRRPTTLTDDVFLRRRRRLGKANVIQFISNPRLENELRWLEEEEKGFFQALPKKLKGNNCCFGGFAKISLFAKKSWTSDPSLGRFFASCFRRICFCWQPGASRDIKLRLWLQLQLRGSAGKPEGRENCFINIGLASRFRLIFRLDKVLIRRSSSEWIVVFIGKLRRLRRQEKKQRWLGSLLCPGALLML